ncbi:hypothetical protein [Staphylococcus caeli]|uniref:hypothetical protein n=1 Tax=Staphylococcus caeli TaxID=2201815 RepID=UPI003F56D631
MQKTVKIEKNSYIYRIKFLSRIYHYHVFENAVETFDKYDLSKIREVLPIVAFGKFERKSKVNFGKVTEKP